VRPGGYRLRGRLCGPALGGRRGGRGSGRYLSWVVAQSWTNEANSRTWYRRSPLGYSGRVAAAAADLKLKVRTGRSCPCRPSRYPPGPNCSAICGSGARTGTPVAGGMFWCSPRDSALACLRSYVVEGVCRRRVKSNRAGQDEGFDGRTTEIPRSGLVQGRICH
jgi:hypothetical protein